MFCIKAKHSKASKKGISVEEDGTNLGGKSQKFLN